MMKIINVLSVMFFVLCGVSFADKVFPDQLLTAVARAVSGLEDADLSVIPLNEDIYSAVKNYMNEIRVIDSDQKDVPFTVQKHVREQSTVNIIRHPALFKKVREEKNNRLDIYLVPETPFDSEIAGLELKFAAENFERRVVVAVYEEGNWRVLTQAIVCDFSKHIPFRREEAVFPSPVKGSLFRIIIDNITENIPSPYSGAIREITGDADYGDYAAILHRPETITPERVNFIVMGTTRTALSDVLAERGVSIEDRADKEDRTVVKFTAQNIPLSTLRVLTSSTNFNREYTLEAVRDAGEMHDPASWQTVARGRIVSCNYSNISLNELNIDFPESRFYAYRLKISNGGEPPLADLDIRASGPVYRIIMLGAQSDELRVFYSGGTPPPEYHVDLQLGRLSEFRTRNYTLTNDGTNPFIRPGRMKSDSSRAKYILLILFASVIAGLGLFLFRAMRKTAVETVAGDNDETRRKGAP